MKRNWLILFISIIIGNYEYDSLNLSERCKNLAQRLLLRPQLEYSYIIYLFTHVKS